jgi:hypothetical protein
MLKTRYKIQGWSLTVGQQYTPLQCADYSKGAKASTGLVCPNT